MTPSLLLADMDVERPRRMFKTNALGTYLCAREAAHRMRTDRSKRGGAIINLSPAAASNRQTSMSTH
ncbi:hypothetical protein IHE33_08900 [Mycetohabitans endofungorum]|uniref:hypothetical protein n=1 Tax=Mycetohabitans endofungorum TaxID=417203 RepID=UPI0032543252